MQFFLYLCTWKNARADMKTLFLLIALYTISGKQAVPSGDIPEGSACTYEQTGNKSGQLTADNSLMLTLSGYQGLQLQSVTLSMHSNTSAGAGSLQLKVGDADVWVIRAASFNDAEWAGAYSTDWVNISHTFSNLTVRDGVYISLQITGTQNSLYLSSVAVEYAAPEAEAYTVGFRTYSSAHISSLTESKPGSGVLLPNVQIADGTWHFMGWAMSPVDSADQEPNVYYPGTIYYPTSDCTLHAIYYRAGDPQPWYPTDDLTLGDYMIALYEPTTGLMLYAMGEIDDGMIATARDNLMAEDGWVSMPQGNGLAACIYTLDVRNDTLQITHKQSNTAIYLSTGGKFTKSGTGSPAWLIEPAETATDAMPHFGIYGVLGAKKYYISYTLRSDFSIWFRPTADASMLHELLLYALADSHESVTVYSSFAFGNAVTNVSPDQSATYQVPVGPYVLTIQNGKKYLKMRN